MRFYGYQVTGPDQFIAKYVNLKSLNSYPITQTNMKQKILNDWKSIIIKEAKCIGGEKEAKCIGGEMEGYFDAERIFPVIEKLLHEQAKFTEDITKKMLFRKVIGTCHGEYIFEGDKYCDGINECDIAKKFKNINNK